MGFFERLRGLDSFAKTHDEYRTKTVFGGLVTFASCMAIGLLIFAEYVDYRRVTWKSELAVGHSGNALMDVNFDISLPNVPCFALTLDFMDAADRHQNNIDTNVFKIRLNEADQELGQFKDVHLEELMGPNYCGSCHGLKILDQAGNPVCCNSCSAVFAAHEHMGLAAPALEEIEQCKLENWPDLIKNHANEGCRMKGTVRVSRLNGNFHFALGKSFDIRGTHVHDVRFLQGLKVNFFHRIHGLSFGVQHGNMINPLDNSSQGNPAMDQSETSKSHSYYMKVVGTEFRHISGLVEETNQYTVSRSLEESNPNGVSGLFFYYEISPITVINTEWRRSWTSFATSTLAITGGVYTIAALLDGLMFHAERRLAMKRALGKAT